MTILQNIELDWGDRKLIWNLYNKQVAYIYLYFASEAATYINVQTQIKNHKRENTQKHNL